MVGLQVLVLAIGVRIPALEQNKQQVIPVVFILFKLKYGDTILR